MLHSAVSERPMASTKLLQLRPEVVRAKDYVVTFKEGDPIYPTCIECPYDFIAIGSKAAVQLAMIGRRVIAVYLPAGDTISDLIPAEMLIGINDVSTVDELEGRNFIVLDDDTFNKSYSHVVVASGVDDCIEIRRPISNSSQILETLTAWMNLFLSKTTEIRGIHVLLVIISLILGKLCLDFSLLRRDFSVMQQIYKG
jgi:hypothetical protein